MKCSNCGKLNQEHPLCPKCAEKHLISYLVAHWDLIKSELAGTIEGNFETPEEFLYQLFTQDMWFDIYPEKVYESLEWFFSGEGYQNGIILQCLETLLWFDIVQGHPKLQKVLIDHTANGFEL